nr:hypothetical protein [Gemmatimonadota bacterium]
MSNWYERGDRVMACRNVGSVSVDVTKGTVGVVTHAQGVWSNPWVRFENGAEVQVSPQD